MTGVDVELHVLRSWAVTLDGLDPLAVPGDPVDPALVSAVDQLNREVTWLRESVLAAVRSYEAADAYAAGTVNG